ncbi:hypothetical protein [Marinomonas gallaica]|uniref:hypothetical protein n=1 Tax=Marinomonas gallaica TaxID=1806667 RepID=UPI003A901E19
MDCFDKNFESLRLKVFAKQYPEIMKDEGKLIFIAEDNEDYFSHGCWILEDHIQKMIIDTDFKLQLILLIEILMQHRSQHNVTPRKEGIVFFGHGDITIKWYPAGSGLI